MTTQEPSYEGTVPGPGSRRLDGRRTGDVVLQIERAKGVLMGRYHVTEAQAHAMLRRHARNSNLRMLDVANAVLETHLLFGERRQ